MTKRDVYNGYQEAYMTGLQIKEFLSNAYVTFGRHHSMISSTKIDFNRYPKIKDTTTYRVFFNDDFIKIMNSETDANIYFIGYTNIRPKWAKD